MNDLEHRVKKLERRGRFSLERNSIHHGETTVYSHSLHVARASLILAKKLGIRVHKRELTVGALLHDYYLYDWHHSGEGHRLHGFRHPYTALKNAKKDYHIGKIEENIIVRHMFPLTPIPPACREAWIVCIADKYCAVMETFNRSKKHGRKKHSGGAK